MVCRSPEALLKQDFTPAARIRGGWVTSRIFALVRGWLYLAVIYHVCGRGPVIGWSMSSRMTAQLACDALQMALWRHGKCRKMSSMLPDRARGDQYCSADYQSLLKRHNLRGKYERQGCCYDNACAEGFFNTLVECNYPRRTLSTGNNADSSV